MQTVLDSGGVSEVMGRLADEIAASIPTGAPVAVVGIRNRGDVLADRLITLLGQRGVAEILHGVLDITLYRDDLAEKGGTAEVRGTEIDFELTGAYLVLVDDVLYTGRTVRAALDALVDFGRARAVRLAVLVDRPERELPIQADFVGVKVEAGFDHVRVGVVEVDGADVVEAQ